jgi:hypothetical protein
LLCPLTKIWEEKTVLIPASSRISYLHMQHSVLTRFQPHTSNGGIAKERPSCLWQQSRLLITVLRRYCFRGQIHSIPGYWSIPQYSWSNLLQFSSCRGSKIVTVFSMKTVIFITVFTGITGLQYSCQSDSIPQYS